MNKGKAEPCNEVETFSERWQLAANRWLSGTVLGKIYFGLDIPKFRGFFLIFKIKTKSDATSFWRMFLARSGRNRYITSECAET